MVASSCRVVGAHGAQKSDERSEDLREVKSSSVVGTVEDSLVVSIDREGRGGVGSLV